MKRLSILFFLLIVSIKGFSQYLENKKKELENLKKCTALVIGVDDPTAPKWVKFQEQVSKYWTLIPVKVLSVKEARHYQRKPKYATLQFCKTFNDDYENPDFAMPKSSGSQAHYGEHAQAVEGSYYGIFVFSPDKKNNIEYHSVFMQCTDRKGSRIMSISTIINLLRFAQNELSGTDDKYMKKKDDDHKYVTEGALKRLETYDLVIPNDNLISGMFGMEASPKKIEKDLATINKDYPYKSRIVSVEEADSLMLAGAPQTATFCYIRVGQETTLFVVDDETGEILYCHTWFTLVGKEGIRESDFKNLGKAVAKGKF